MSRVLFGIEEGLRVFAENSDTSYVDFLFGAAAPGGDAGKQDAAPIGSIYLRTDGSLYQKKFSTNATSDWVLNGSSNATVGTFKPNGLRVVTNDTITAGVRDLTASPFADDQSPLISAADFVVGDYVIGDADGTPVLFEVTAVSAPNVTFAAVTPTLASGDVYFTHNYLPDTPAGQEGAALVYYNGTLVYKIADIDWNLATGITLTGSYVAAVGNVTAGDTVEAAIAKLDGVNDAQDTLLGTAQGALDLGTFTGTIIPNNVAVKPALQALETELDKVKLVQATGTVAQNTPTIVDSVLVDAIQGCKWVVVARSTANPNRVKSLEIEAVHNGHSAADATNIDDSVEAKLNVGNFNLKVDTSLTGSGATQAMNLVIDTTEAAGISFTIERRYDVPLAG